MSSKSAKFNKQASFKQKLNNKQMQKSLIFTYSDTAKVSQVTSQLPVNG